MGTRRWFVWTEQQRAIIESDVRNQVVFAGPGSGKTAVLTQHIASVIRNRMVAPSEILALTFTRQAAQEMRDRLVRESGLSRNQVESVQIGTFHANVFRWLLRVIPDIPVLMKETEQHKFVEAAIRAAGCSGAIDARRVLAELARVRSNWPVTELPPPFQRIGACYESLKRKHKRWDFDDILVQFAARIAQGTRVHLPRYRYILVDEFQDTNQIQWHILERVFHQLDCKLFVVGDDDQSIYGFRGTSPVWLVEFPNRITDVDVHFLVTNFRSDVAIVKHATRLIEHNRLRVRKPFRPHSIRDGLCIVRSHASDCHQFAAVGESVAAAIRRSGTVGVLARTRMELMQAHAALRPMSFRRDRVELRTFHEGKGREWDEVHILNAVQRNPHTPDLPQSTQATEEERRLFYVAMTRARHRLYLHYPATIGGKTMRPSQFLAESDLI
jgi:DNA helicase-2/ATP-dependent DNA helicase PcrA